MSTDANGCIYGLAWRGACKAPVADGQKCCDEHKGIKCSSCGAPATGECNETMGFVCGFPLCDNCEHTLCSNGCNSGGERPPGYGMHCKKGSQVFKGWYEEGADEFNKAALAKLTTGATLP